MKNRIAEWTGPASIAALFAALTAWSWRKWIDPRVDAGVQLYLPWQIASGKTFWKDVRFVNGPLSAHLNALWFKLFGVSITTLILCNLAILALLTWLIYRFFNRCCGRLTATSVCLLFLSIFAFSFYTTTANYNYVFPYSAEAIHGMTLAVAMMLCLIQGPESGELSHFALAGFLLGLVLMTKLEVAVAATCAFATALALRMTGKKPKVVLRQSAVALGACAIAPSAFFIYFLERMDAVDAFKAITVPWYLIFNTRIGSNPFTQSVMGLDRPWENLGRMIQITTMIALLIGAAAAVDVAASRGTRRKRWLLGATLLALFVATASRFPWIDAGRPLPLIAFALWIGFSLLYLRGARAETRSSAFALSVWSAFSWPLLLRMFLNAKLYHYGFYMAMPATLLTAATLLSYGPRLVEQVGGEGKWFKAAALCALATAAIVHLRWSDGNYRSARLNVGKGSDSLKTPFELQSQFLGMAADWLDSHTTPQSTLFALPEGAMLNYLARRANPTPYLTIVDMQVYSPAEILRSLQSSPPDFVAVIPRSSREWGFDSVGSDEAHGKAILDWIDSNYRTEVLMGPQPVDEKRFLLKILKRVRP